MAMENAHCNKNDLRSILTKELNATKTILLDIECGLVKPENLPIAPQFYIEKKNRIEAILWALDVEDRALINYKKPMEREDVSS